MFNVLKQYGTPGDFTDEIIDLYFALKKRERPSKI
jgi:hypothetical protein